MACWRYLEIPRPSARDQYPSYEQVVFIVLGLFKDLIHLKSWIVRMLCEFVTLIKTECEYTAQDVPSEGESIVWMLYLHALKNMVL